MIPLIGERIRGTKANGERFDGVVAVIHPVGILQGSVEIVLMDGTRVFPHFGDYWELKARFLQRHRSK